jgi:Heparinase II/III-like protein/Heparinase II/III N-terminus
MLLARARTLWRLGLTNVFWVAAYRVAKSTGIYHRTGTAFEPFELTADLTQAAFDRATSVNALAAHNLRNGNYRAFGGEPRHCGWPLQWHRNILSGETSTANLPWWKKSKTARGDIKGIWELSRFDWALDMAKAHLMEPDAGHLTALNDAIADWQHHNRPYLGPNWECGQETSLRLLNLLEVVRILGIADQPPRGFLCLIAIHLRRIALTLRYAMAQDNNHGTSEASALFAGGAYLTRFGTGGQTLLGTSCKRHGRRWLENRAKKLIFADGGFAQYSVNYHRLMLDSLAISEFWRTKLNEPAFSKAFYDKAAVAVRWFAALVDPTSGDCPNLGSNDGAHILRVVDEPYRDFRLSLERCVNTFKVLKSDTERSSKLFPDFGLGILDMACLRVFLRLPMATFRPSQADPLHLDVWASDGTALLVDSGTLSYADSKSFDSFVSIAHHNTVQFDDREPMRRWSRFLNMDWLTTETSGFAQGGSLNGSYRDYRGARHQRLVEIKENSVEVRDIISGHSSKATLRWHFAQLDWVAKGASFQSGRAVITCKAKGCALQQRLTNKLYSPTYANAQPQLCLEVEVGPDCIEIQTTITALTS